MKIPGFARSVAALLFLGLFRVSAGTFTNEASGVQTNLPIPSIGSGGTGTFADFTYSRITITNIPASETISDVNVTISLDHTFVGDLIIRLIGPGGTNGPSTILTTNSNNSANGYHNTTFDDQASGPLSSGTDPYTGSFLPQQPLSVFNGTFAPGDWTLEIEDVTGGDQGTFLGWSLEITTGQVVVTPVTLSIQLTNGTVVISWPAAASGYTLETKATLSTPAWMPVATAPVVAGDRNTVTLPATDPAAFFRLRR